MDRLLDVVVLDVGEYPDVAGVLAHRVAGQLAAPGALEVALVRVFGRDADRVEVEDVIVGRSEPVDGFVTPGEPLRAMQPVLEMPDDAVAELEAVVLEDAVENHVERKHLAAAYVVADLPAERSARVQDPHAFGDDPRLHLHVALQRRAALVGLSQVVGRGGDDQHHRIVRQIAHEREVVRAGHHRLAVGAQLHDVRHPLLPMPPVPASLRERIWNIQGRSSHAYDLPLPGGRREEGGGAPSARRHRCRRGIPRPDSPTPPPFRGEVGRGMPAPTGRVVDPKPRLRLDGPSIGGRRVHVVG